MNILAIDTSTTVLSVAISQGNKLIGEHTTNIKLNHSTRLMPAINELFNDTGLKPNDLDGIAVAKGPGSYTGVRIGVTTAKVLCWTLNIPLIGVSSLAVLASNVGVGVGPVCPIFDARRGQVYTGLYSIDEKGVPASIEADRIVLFDSWLEQHAHLKDVLVFVGNDLSIHRPAIEEKWGKVNTPVLQAMHIPRAGNLAGIGAEMLKRGHVDDVHTFAPEYLQITEAEYNWNQQQKANK